jgi:hypothetical protein
VTLCLWCRLRSVLVKSSTIWAFLWALNSDVQKGEISGEVREENEAPEVFVARR